MLVLPGLSIFEHHDPVIPSVFPQPLDLALSEIEEPDQLESMTQEYGLPIFLSPLLPCDLPLKDSPTRKRHSSLPWSRHFRYCTPTASTCLHDHILKNNFFHLHRSIHCHSQSRNFKHQLVLDISRKTTWLAYPRHSWHHFFQRQFWSEASNTMLISAQRQRL